MATGSAEEHYFVLYYHGSLKLNVQEAANG
jgi:hypothetical protein